MKKRIGLIAGGTRYPLYFARAARERGVEIVAVGIREETEPELEKYAGTVHWVNLGELGRLFQIFQSEGVTEAVMAGKVTKSRLFDGKIVFDQELKSLLGEVEDRKDNSLLQAVARRLAAAGIRLIDSTTFLSELLPKAGVFSRREPDSREWEDVRFGERTSRQLAGLDVGMTVVVKDKTVLAVEAIEGTDETIRRGGRLGREGTVVVKIGRPRQDMRFDLPVAGTGTIRAMIEVKAAVLAFEAGRTLLIDREEMLSRADENGIAVVGI